jgi:hypothetical protein
MITTVNGYADKAFKDLQQQVQVSTFWQWLQFSQGTSGRQDILEWLIMFSL